MTNFIDFSPLNLGITESASKVFVASTNESLIDVISNGSFLNERSGSLSSNDIIYLTTDANTSPQLTMGIVVVEDGSFSFKPKLSLSELPWTQVDSYSTKWDSSSAFWRYNNDFSKIEFRGRMVSTVASNTDPMFNFPDDATPLHNFSVPVDANIGSVVSPVSCGTSFPVCGITPTANENDFVYLDSIKANLY